MPGQVQVQALAASAAVNTQGTGTPVDCAGWASLVAMCSITSGAPTAASVTKLRVWLQGQVNPGGAWSDLPLLWRNKTLVGLTAAASFTTIGRGVNSSACASLVDEVTSVTAAVTYYGAINNPPPLVRAAWDVTVSGGGFTTFVVESYLSMVPSK